MDKDSKASRCLVLCGFVEAFRELVGPRCTTSFIFFLVEVFEITLHTGVCKPSLGAVGVDTGGATATAGVRVSEPTGTGGDPRSVSLRCCLMGW